MPDRITALTVAQLARALADLPDDQQDLPVVMDGCGGCAHRPVTVEFVPPSDRRALDGDAGEVWLNHEYS